MHPLRRLIAIAALLAAGSPLTAQDIPTDPEGLRQLGRELIGYEIEDYGRDLNPVWRRDVSMIIDSVRIAADYRTHPVIWEITGDSSLNASAGPGGMMLINVGLPLFCTEMGKKVFPNDARAAHRRYIGCMAAVIGHEFGHLALGHSDSIAQTIQRRRDIAERRQRGRGIAEYVRDSVLMHGLRVERQRELHADEAGALYIMRAGWQIQDAIDTFTEMDLADRNERYWRGQLTWLLDHPRSSERAALLEQRRAQLKLLQRDYDDAVTLIEMDVLPDSALAMLNRVLKDMPFLTAAQHAKAVLLARQWVASASVTDLKVRPTFAAYQAQFYTSIRGGDPTLLRNAREAFAKIVSSGGAHPYSHAALALLEAYSGNTADAVKRAERAVSVLSDDAEALNALGVAYFLAGRHADAYRTFAKAEDLLDGDPTPEIAFNIARAAFTAGDSAAARRYVDRYVRYDRSSSWGREAVEMQRRLAGAGPAQTGGATTTPTTGMRAPEIAGVRLGAPASQVLRALGNPDERDLDSGTGMVWLYESKGLMLIIHPVRGAIAIALESRAAGDVAGVRVGDPLASALRTLGPVAEREKDGTSEAVAFDRGTWRIIVAAEDGVVTMVAVAAKE